jgi:hypothetical protein
MTKTTRGCKTNVMDVGRSQWDHVVHQLPPCSKTIAAKKSLTNDATQLHFSEKSWTTFSSSSVTHFFASFLTALTTLASLACEMQPKHVQGRVGLPSTLRWSHHTCFKTLLLLFPPSPMGLSQPARLVPCMEAWSEFAQCG